MSEYRDSRIEETLRSIDNSLKRLTERFCSRERVDVAEIKLKAFTDLIDNYLEYYDTIERKHSLIWNKMKYRKDYAAWMADSILKWIKDKPQPMAPPQSPLPD
jgi:hypothetical protein